MKTSYLRSLAQCTVKKADLDSEIEKAKQLRDGSLIDDLFWNVLTGGAYGGLGGAVLGGLGGGAKGFIDATRPNAYGIHPYDWVPFSPSDTITVGDLDHVHATISNPRRFDKAYDLYGGVGFANEVVKNIKPEAIKGLAIGAGLGGLYSLLTYYYRKAKAEKKLKELGIK